jgi:hypothetical protein
VSPADANVGWRFRAGSPLVAGPVTTPRLPRRLVIAGCADGTVFAVPAAGWNESGPTNASWSRKLLGAVNEDPCVAEYVDGAKKGVMVIVPASDNGLHGLEATSGTVRWSVRRESPFAGQPFACNGRVFARCSDRMVVADIATGSEPWSFSKAEAAPKGFELATKAFASDASRAYLGAGDNTVMRVDGRSGAVLATQDARELLLRHPRWRLQSPHRRDEGRTRRRDALSSALTTKKDPRWPHGLPGFVVSGAHSREPRDARRSGQYGETCTEKRSDPRASQRVDEARAVDETHPGAGSTNAAPSTGANTGSPGPSRRRRTVRSPRVAAARSPGCLDAAASTGRVRST